MTSSLSHPATERAQPWLGTLVSIRVLRLAEPDAHRAIDAAFQEVAEVHRLMSFHAPDSELTRLNRSSPGSAVRVHPFIFEVLRKALAFSAASGGSFDVTVGAELVAWQLLPDSFDPAAAQGGSWRDIELLPGNRVIFHRPLCVDLGGIAKGFAVDRATQALRAHGALRTVVNAGGDIRVQGNGAEPIRLAAQSSENTMPVLELADGSVASSSGHLQRRRRGAQFFGPHVDGIERCPAPTDRFACVLADDCITADALTKVVMAQGMQSADLLRRFGASAFLHDPATGWQSIETERAVAL